LNWLEDVTLPLSCEAQIRYRQEAQKCTLKKMDRNDKIDVSFESPQRAITPGQVCVFYDGETVLGSGIIMA